MQMKRMDGNASVPRTTKASGNRIEHRGSGIWKSHVSTKAICYFPLHQRLLRPRLRPWLRPWLRRKKRESNLNSEMLILTLTLTPTLQWRNKFPSPNKRWSELSACALVAQLVTTGSSMAYIIISRWSQVRNYVRLLRMSLRLHVLPCMLWSLRWPIIILHHIPARSRDFCHWVWDTSH